MRRTPRYKSDAFKAIHSSAEGMFRIGTIDKATMRRFHESCLAGPCSVIELDIQDREELAFQTASVTRLEQGAPNP